MYMDFFKLLPDPVQCGIETFHVVNAPIFEFKS